jgi:hypothetical protein
MNSPTNSTRNSESSTKDPYHHSSASTSNAKTEIFSSTKSAISTSWRNASKSTHQYRYLRPWNIHFHLSNLARTTNEPIRPITKNLWDLSIILQHSLDLTYPLQSPSSHSSIRIQPQLTSTLPATSSNTPCQQRTSRSNTAEVPAQFKSTDTRTRTGDPISRNGNQQPDTFFTMNGGPISWTSKKQTTVALSTMEAEYMSLSDASRELIAHVTFFLSVSIDIKHPTLFTDNKAAEAIVKREPDYQRSKHIDIRYHFIRDHYENGAFDVKQATRGHPHETTPSYQTSTHRTCAAT